MTRSCLCDWSHCRLRSTSSSSCDARNLAGFRRATPRSEVSPYMHWSTSAAQPFRMSPWSS
eukprot:4148421-Pyramimonas_sp.AAC.1